MDMTSRVILHPMEKMTENERQIYLKKLDEDIQAYRRTLVKRCKANEVAYSKNRGAFEKHKAIADALQKEGNIHFAELNKEVIAFYGVK